jgi:hypothetical protein
MQRLQLSVYELLVHAVLCHNFAGSNLACWPIVTNTRAVAVRFTGQVLSTAIILPVYVCCQANCFRRHAINCLIRRQRMICNLVSLSTIACMLAVTWRLLGLSIPRLAMFTLLFVTLIAFSILALLCIALRRQPQLVAMITSGRTCPEVPQVNHRGGTVADAQTDNRAANISDQREVDGNPQGQPPTNGPVSAPADPDTDLNAVNEACLRDLRSVLDIIDVSYLDPDLLALYLDPSAGIVERMGILRSHPVHKDDAHRLMVCFRHNMKLGREAVFKRRALSSNPVSDSSELLQPSSDPCLVKALPAAVEILPQVSNKIPDALQPTIRVHKLAPTPQPSQLGSPLRNPLSEPLTTVASLPSSEPVTPVQPCSDNHVPRITSDAPHRIRIHRISELPRDDRYGHGTVHIARTPTLLVRAPVDSPSAQDKTTRLEPSAILRDTVYNAPQAPLDSHGAPHRIRIHRLTDDDIVVDSALASNLHSVHSAPSFQQPALGSPARCIEHPIAAVGGGSTRQLQSQPRSQIGEADHILPLSTDPSEGVHILACPIPASKFFDHSAQEPVSPLVAQQPQSDVAPFPDSSSPTLILNESKDLSDSLHYSEVQSYIDPINPNSGITQVDDTNGSTDPGTPQPSREYVNSQIKDPTSSHGEIALSATPVSSHDLANDMTSAHSQQLQSPVTRELLPGTDVEKLSNPTSVSNPPAHSGETYVPPHKRHHKLLVNPPTESLLRIRITHSLRVPLTASDATSSPTRILASVPDPPSPFSAAVLRAKLRHEKPQREPFISKGRRARSARLKQNLSEDAQPTATQYVAVSGPIKVLPVPLQRVPSPSLLHKEASDTQPREDRLSPINRWADCQEAYDLYATLRATRTPTKCASVDSSDNLFTAPKTVATLTLDADKGGQSTPAISDVRALNSPTLHSDNQLKHNPMIISSKTMQNVNGRMGVNQEEGHDRLGPIVASTDQRSPQPVVRSSSSSKTKDACENSETSSLHQDQHIERKPSLATESTVPGSSDATPRSTPAGTNGSLSSHERKRKRNRKRNKSKTHGVQNSPTDVKWPVPVNSKLKPYYSSEAASRVKDGKYHMTPEEQGTMKLKTGPRSPRSLASYRQISRQPFDSSP